MTLANDSSASGEADASAATAFRTKEATVDVERAARRLAGSYQDGEISRRELIGGALKLGMSVTAAAAILAACRKSSDKTGAASWTSSTTSATHLAGKIQIPVGFGTGNAPAQIPVQEALARRSPPSTPT